MSDILNTVIIGSGPAGCTAAIYACRANLEPVIISGSTPGGQLTITPEIGNWPGAKDNPAGFALMQSLLDHAKQLGTKFISSMVESIDDEGAVKILTLSDGQILKTKTVIIATGAAARYLGLESEEKYKGRGVSACATCDGFFFRGKDVAVIGGGSAAFVEAAFLSKMCNKVYLVHRRESFRAEQVLVDKLHELEKQGKVEFILNANVIEIEGNGEAVTGLKLNAAGAIRHVPLAGVFVAIGHKPATEVFASVVEIDSDGTIKTGFGAETACSAKGFFAAGDCADKVYRQAITSAGQGCKAALDVEHYLLEQS